MITPSAVRSPAFRLFQAVLGALLAHCLLAVPSSAVNSFFFDAARGFDTGGNPYTLNLGDFNADGEVDLVVSNYSEKTLSFLLGNGDATFMLFDTLPLPGNPFDCALDDLNGDGHLDIVAAHFQDTGVSLFLGSGDGHFIDQGVITGHVSSNGVAIGDVNGDLIPDLALLNGYEDEVVIFVGIGNGAFSEAGSFGAGVNVKELVLVDLNNDQDLDLAVINRWSEDVSVLLGQGDGSFLGAVSYPVIGSDSDMIAASDLDADGAVDLVVGGGYYTLSILMGLGDGTFSEAEGCDAGQQPNHVDIKDLDDDGILDMVVGGAGASSDDSGQIAVLIGRGDGTFNAPRFHSPGSYVPVRLADLDHDDLLDLVFLGHHINQVVVMLGKGGGDFVSLPTYEVDDGAWDLVHGDFTGDGRMDLAFAVNGSVEAHVSLHLGNGDGSFTEGPDIPAGVGPQYLTCCDQDLDGDLDLVVMNNGEGLSLLLNHGDGTFSPPVLLTDWTWVKDVVAGDLNNDGFPDLVSPVSTHEVAILLNDGQGGYHEAVFYPAADIPGTCAVGDLDGDGDRDLVLGDVDGFFWVMLNEGDGTFGDAVSTPLAQAMALDLGDLNGDAVLDLVVGQGFGDQVTTLFGTGDGTFVQAHQMTAHGATEFLLLRDMNLDGLLDLLVVGRDESMLTLYTGDGMGGFADGRSFPVNQSLGFTCGDLDHDGDLDSVLFGHSVFTGRMYVLLNNTVAQPCILAGPGSGADNPPLARVFPMYGGSDPLVEWQAYGIDRFGVNTGWGNLDGDLNNEIVTGPGPGAVFGPHVRGWDWDRRATVSPIPGLSFLAYGTHRWGVNVACGELDNDGFDEIITGAGPGAVFGPHVRGWDYDGSGTVSPIPGVSFLAYGTNRWGVNVACGDLDGDGFDEIVTGAGPGAIFGPHVRGWNVDGSGTATPIPGISFLAYGTNRWGVNVTCGDVDGDGIDEILTGAGPGAVFGAHVRGWEWPGAGSVTQMPEINFFAYPSTRWGVNVACSNLDADQADEILTGPGPDPAADAWIRGWDFSEGALHLLAEVDFLAYPAGDVTHGVKPAGAGRGCR